MLKLFIAIKNYGKNHHRYSIKNYTAWYIVGVLLDQKPSKGSWPSVCIDESKISKNVNRFERNFFGNYSFNKL